MTFLTVDPGLGGTGWTLWEEEELFPLSYGVIDIRGPEAKLDWVARAQIVSYRFYTDVLIRECIHPLSAVHIEYPRLMMTAGGMASAERGDVFKLMFLVGALAECVWMTQTTFKPLPVNQWKGTMSKDAVAERVAARLGVAKDFWPNHTMDSVGMGLYLKGVLNVTEKKEIRKSSRVPVRRFSKRVE